MKSFTITKNDAGQRAGPFYCKNSPPAAGLAQSEIYSSQAHQGQRQRAQRDTRLSAGDLVEMYVNDEFFDTPKEENAYLTVTTPKLSIVYEDENIRW